MGYRVVWVGVQAWEGQHVQHQPFYSTPSAAVCTVHNAFLVQSPCHSMRSTAAGARSPNPLTALESAVLYGVVVSWAKRNIRVLTRADRAPLAGRLACPA